MNRIVRIAFALSFVLLALAGRYSTTRAEVVTRVDTDVVTATAQSWAHGYSGHIVVTKDGSSYVVEFLGNPADTNFILDVPASALETSYGDAYGVYGGYEITVEQQLYEDPDAPFTERYRLDWRSSQFAGHPAP